MASDSRKNRRQNLLTKYQHLVLRIDSYLKMTLIDDVSAEGGFTDPSTKYDTSYASNGF